MNDAYLLCIKVDYNDADYAECITEVKAETLAKLSPVFVALKAHRGRWPAGERKDATDNPAMLYPILTEEQIEDFEEYCPRCEYGFHTIESVVTYQVAGKCRYI